MIEKYSTHRSLSCKIFEGNFFISNQTITLLQIFCELLLYSKVIFISMRVANLYFLEELLSENGLKFIVVRIKSRTVIHVKGEPFHCKTPCLPACPDAL